MEVIRFFSGRNRSFFVDKHIKECHNFQHGGKTMNTIKPYENDRYSKSNLLISGKFKSSLYENKILAISLSKIAKQEFVTDPETKEIVCTMHASELKQMLGVRHGSFYDTLENTARAMSSRTIGLSNPESHEFEYFPIVTKAEYGNGIFKIRYSPHFIPYISDLKSNYTVLSLPLMLNFDSVWTFRMYELLRSRCYYPRGQERTDGKYLFNISLAELKLELGAVNADTDAVKKILNKTINPDYNKAVEKSTEKSFNLWADFKKAVLVKAISEIEEKTPMRVQYETLKTGRGGKICSLNFCVIKDINEVQNAVDNNDSSEIVSDENIVVVDSNTSKRELDENEIFDIEADTKYLFKAEKLSLKDIRAICKAANYDMDRIQKAHDVYKNSGSNIDNVVGWVISAIKEEYDANKKRPVGFEERDYNIEQIEKELLSI